MEKMRKLTKTEKVVEVAILQLEYCNWTQAKHKIVSNINVNSVVITKITIFTEQKQLYQD